MFKSLAVAALLCNVSAEAIAAAKAPATTLNDEPSKDFAIHFGSLFTTGFLRGSKVGDIYADDFVKCLEREDTADHIFNHGNEEIEKFLRTKDADVAADALNTMIYFIIDLAKEKNQRIGHPICEVFDQKKLNYKEIDFAIGELMNPETGLNNFMGKLYFNRQNIDKEAVEMLKAWELKDYEKFGFLLGETLVKHEGEDPKLIEERFGSEFAVGFLKGARVGDVQITELFKCLEFEPKADEIFRQANMDIGKMFKNRDKNEGVKGLDDLIRFVIDMAMEKAPSGQHKCEAFGDMDLKYDDLKKVLELLKAPESTMKMEGGHFTFNGANLDREADWMVHEYVETNFIGFGYALGDTLAKHDGLHPHTEVAKTTDAKDTKVAGRTALTKVEANNTIEWGSKFTAGFLAGGNVGKINWEDFVHCLDREEKAVEIFVKAEEEIKKFFEDKDEAAGVEGLKDMVKFVTDLATERNQKYGHPTCEVFEQTGLSYEKLDKALHEFYDPDTTLMYQDHKVYFNRQDIDWEAEHMVAKLKERDLIGFGYELGFSMIAHSGESPKLEAQRWGSEFAVGFLKGAGVGEFNITELFDCLKLEDNADQLFLHANRDIGRMFETHDANEGVKGLDELIEFITVMASDREGRTRLCPAFYAEGLKYDDLKAILQLQKNPETTIRYLDNHMTFNHQNIDHEARWMAHEYMGENAVGFGYALGDTLRKYDGRDLFLY